MLTADQNGGAGVVSRRTKMGARFVDGGVMNRRRGRVPCIERLFLLSPNRTMLDHRKTWKSHCEAEHLAREVSSTSAVDLPILFS